MAIPISYAVDLAKIGNDAGYPLDGNYVQTRDIDCVDIANWSPIGPTGGGFTGIYDGHGYKITNLHRSVTTPGPASVNGLFEIITGVVTRIDVAGTVYTKQTNDEGNANGIAAAVNEGGVLSNSICRLVITTESDRSTNMTSGGLAWVGGATLVDGPINCLFLGSISGISKTGGNAFALVVTGSTVSCYYDKTVNTGLQDEVLRGHTTPDLKTYPNAIYDTWDTSVWLFVNGEYPSLIQGEIRGDTMLIASSTSENWCSDGW